MGCVQSKKIEVVATQTNDRSSIQETTNVVAKSSTMQISVIPVPTVKKQESIPEETFGYDDLDRSIMPTISEAANEIKYVKYPTPPSSQSYELAAEVINTTSSSNDETKTINSYITTAINYRNNHGGKCDLNVQLKKKRLEVICVGAFMQLNDSTQKYEILSYDTFIPNSNIKYRPDLILRDKETDMIVHVEIDEKGHASYDQQAEAEREKLIEEHYKRYEYMRIRFNPNKYSNKMEMAVKFAQLLNSNDGIISVVHRNRIPK